MQPIPHSNFRPVLLVCSMLFTPLHSTVSGLRLRILSITPGVSFSDHPTKQGLAVGTFSPSTVRATCWLLRSDSSFSVAVDLLLSAGFHGGEYRSRMDMSAPILVQFGPSPALVPWYLRSLDLACYRQQRFRHRFACASHSNLLGVFVASSLPFDPISSRFLD